MKGLLVIDIGNTSIKFGLKDPHWHIKRLNHEDNTLTKLQAMIEELQIYEAVVSSVVPSMTAQITNLLQEKGIPFHVITPQDTGGLKLMVRNPDSFGTDRLANAVAGFDLTGKDTIVVDLGSAITTTVINRKAEILGGTIMPGIKMMFQALSHFTASLPAVEPSHAEGPFGKDTKSSIISGIIYGTAGAVERTVQDIKKAIPDSTVILTGGGAQLIGKYLRINYIYEPYLTLEGLRLIYLRRKNE